MHFGEVKWKNQGGEWFMKTLMPFHPVCNYPDIITFLGKTMQDFIRRIIYSYYFRKIILTVTLRTN